MRNRIKNCDKMGELRKGNLCLNHIRTASPVGRSGRERTVALPQHTSYGLHQAARAWSSRCRHFASAHFIRAAPRPCTGSSSRCAFASAHFIWAAPQLLVVAVQPLVLCLSTLHMGCTERTVKRYARSIHLCLSTLHMGCTGKTAQRHGYSIVKCAVRG